MAHLMNEEQGYQPYSKRPAKNERVGSNRDQSRDACQAKFGKKCQPFEVENEQQQCLELEKQPNNGNSNPPKSRKALASLVTTGGPALRSLTLLFTGINRIPLHA